MECHSWAQSYVCYVLYIESGAGYLLFGHWPVILQGLLIGQSHARVGSYKWHPVPLFSGEKLRTEETQHLPPSITPWFVLLKLSYFSTLYLLWSLCYWRITSTANSWTEKSICLCVCVCQRSLVWCRWECVFMYAEEARYCCSEGGLILEVGCYTSRINVSGLFWQAAPNHAWTASGISAHCGDIGKSGSCSQADSTWPSDTSLAMFTDKKNNNKKTDFHQVK